jgi:hypothetical protein|tara:strand:- start:361 stop:987 length:627 start_codon:yes stop_codon:yes gene_type:complete
MPRSQFNGVVPGQSLTMDKPRNVPWERPPQIDTVEDALSFYMTKFSDEDVMDDMLVAIESGVAIKPLVESLYTMGVMRGIHGLDVGLLVAPALMEFFAAVADSYEIPYKFSKKDPKKAMEEKERSRVTMLLQAAINRAEESGEVDEGTELLKGMAEYTASEMSPEEAAESAPEEAIEEPMEATQEEMPTEGMQQQPMPQQGGGLMARG